MIYEDALKCTKVTDCNEEGIPVYKIDIKLSLIGPDLKAPISEMSEDDMLLYTMANMMSMDDNIQDNLEEMAKRSILVRDVLNQRDENLVKQLKAHKRK